MQGYSLFAEDAIRAGISAFIIICYTISFSTASAQNVEIKGSIVLERQQTPSLSLSNGGYQSNPASRSKHNSTSNEILIWLEDEGQNNPYAKDQNTTPQVLDQVNKQFKPRLIGVLAGDIVRIENSDPVYHNVFSLSESKRFDVGRRSPADHKDVLFDKPGTVDVFCDIHSDMHAVIKVLPKQTLRWKKLEGDRVSFQFENLPQGKYRLHLFALNNRTESIDIEASRDEQIKLNTLRLSQ